MLYWLFRGGADDANIIRTLIITAPAYDGQTKEHLIYDVPFKLVLFTNQVFISPSVKS